MIEQIYIAVSRGGEPVAILGFLTVGRGSSLPSHAQWIDGREGWWRREPSHTAIFEEVSRAFATGPEVTGYRRIDESEIPKDRSYRDALTDDGGKLAHDMPRARALHLGKLRRQRVDKLADLDRQFTLATAAMLDDDEAKANEAKARAKVIERKRQKLRDMPTAVAPALDAATDTDALKAIALDE